MDLRALIDHTLLKPDATSDAVELLCAEALDFGFASVCVNPCRVPLAFEKLRGSRVAVCSVVGFPLGATSSDAKLAEAGWCLANGASEIDSVMNIGDAKEGNWSCVEEEMKRLAETVHAQDAILKVILETCLLDKSEIVEACERAVAAGADFVKTSTGFAGGGATVEDVGLMAATVSGRCLVKASGGIKTRSDALALVEAGAARIGTSSGIAIAGEPRK
jgi:deoxyribose-phosphate aldolase